MSDAPDVAINYTLNYCTSCGTGLSVVASEFVHRRQEIEIPPIVPKYVEHRLYEKQCTC